MTVKKTIRNILSIDLKLYNPETSPPQTVGYYEGVTLQGKESYNVETVYWNGSKFVQEEWKSCKVLRYFDKHDIINKVKK